VSKQTLSFGLFIIVSVGYIAAYTVTNGFILPLQKIILPDVPILFSVLFLPHGIRVLAIWLLGWRGALYLLPSSYVMWAITVWGSEIELSALHPAVSIACVYAAVMLVGLRIGSVIQTLVDMTTWKQCLIAGLVGSVFNGLGLAMLSQGDCSWYIMSGYTFGDIAGQIVLMLILILIMRLSRTVHSLPE
jgi:hypothetical protein